MLQPRIPNSFSAPSTHSVTSLFASLTALHLTSSHHHLPLTQRRHASHATQGRANGPTDSAGRRLGLKRSATTYVVPGNIIFRQRGTKWHPGENVGIGRDHTIYAMVAGYVRYYRDPARHKKRKYIGVSLEKEGKGSVLPTPGNAISRRRLGMFASPMKIIQAGKPGEEEARSFLEGHISDNSVGPSSTVPSTPPTIMRPGQYRIANVELARQAELKKVKVRPFDRKDRFYAWRVRTKKIKEKKLARAAMGKTKKKKQSRRGPPKKA
jgi:large subunit ribosomal protein L27